MGVVVIGRNEGERLKRCLRSIPAGFQVVYVDSGSNDDSVDFARLAGAVVIDLDAGQGFTAARARNAGWRSLLDGDPALEFIQFVDGDCEIAAGWFAKALAAIEAEANLAVVFGRRRERFPGRSIYNRMCDDEWNVPIGLVDACGGDALFRASALREADGYSDDLIAGEEPDLCLRLAKLGWRVRRIDAEMTVHDANILSFASWWKRTRRAGFAYAEHVRRHGSNSNPQWRRSLVSIVFWGMVLPASSLLIASAIALFRPLMAAPLLGALLMIYAIQCLRIASRKYKSENDWRFAGAYGGLLIVGKFAEASGALKCWLSTLQRRQQTLIEYK
jgi:glycosyltransferase involved in cell wall biosynthesis